MKSNDMLLDGALAMQDPDAAQCPSQCPSVIKIPSEINDSSIVECDETDTRSSHHQQKHLRKCLVTGEALPKAQMIRFVQDPDGYVVADLAGKLPGRGVWVAAQREALERAVKKNMFARGFKAKSVSFAPQYFQANSSSDGDDGKTVVDAIAALQGQRALNALGLCRRSGELITGFDKVHIAAKLGGPDDLLILANNIGRDGTSKLTNLATRLGIAIMDLFDSQSLSEATGFDGIGYLFVSSVMTRKTAGQPAKHVREEMARYQGLVCDKSGEV